MDNKDQKFIELVVDMAVEASKKDGCGPFAAIVVKDGKIISTAFNEVIKRHDPTAHAEVLAIRRACEVLSSFQLDSCTIYSSCEPCPMCLGAIYWTRPERVVYAASRYDARDAGFDDEFIYHEVSKMHCDRSITFQQLNTKTSKRPFEAWKNSNSKKAY